MGRERGSKKGRHAEQQQRNKEDKEGACRCGNVSDFAFFVTCHIFAASFSRVPVLICSLPVNTSAKLMAWLGPDHVDVSARSSEADVTETGTEAELQCDLCGKKPSQDCCGQYPPHSRSRGWLRLKSNHRHALPQLCLSLSERAKGGML